MHTPISGKTPVWDMCAVILGTTVSVEEPGACPLLPSGTGRPALFLARTFGRGSATTIRRVPPLLPADPGQVVLRIVTVPSNLGFANIAARKR